MTQNIDELERKLMKRLDEIEKKIVKKIEALHSFEVAVQTGDIRKEDF
jgi:tetrahydromethanopterin S-methyltransferase subunit G